MGIKEKLQLAGLNDKEADLYLACLKFGPLSMSNLADQAKIKRSSLYYLIEDLIKKDIIKIVPRGKKNLYDAQSPKKIFLDFEERKNEFEKTLPELEDIKNKKLEIPKIKIQFSEDDLIKEFKKNKSELIALLNIEEIFFNSPKLYKALNGYFKEKQNYKNIIHKNTIGKKFIKLLKTNNNKLIETNTNLSDVIIFNKQVFFINYKNQSVINKIDSPEIYNLQTMLLEEKWNNLK